MTRESLMKLGDWSFKILTPITFALAALWASNLTDSIKELKSKIDAITERLQAVDTRSAVTEQRLIDYIQRESIRQ